MLTCAPRQLTLAQARIIAPWLERAHEVNQGHGVLMFTWAPLNDQPCWVWHGWTDPYSGYAKMRYGAQADAYVHRVNWLVLRGPLRDDQLLDHLCRNRPCTNPWHLQPVSHTVNVQRGARAGELCRNGLHKMEPGNVLVRVRNDLTRYECKACTDMRRERWVEGR